MNTKTMKQTLLTIGLLLAAVPAIHAQAVKLGHIDRQAMMLMLPERKGAEEKMQAFAKSLDERLKAMAAEYQQKVTEAQAAESTMTQTEREMAIREISELEGRIQDAQEKAQEDLAKQEEELLRPMVERTNKVIEEVAKEKGFTYIFDTSTGMVLYWDSGEDILPLVKEKLGIQ
ncbi:MAG: OmpH family outer membrane protein [Flavobacteriales bacterium]|nr:OmpH family outer membrane protein [Flavobacteriales bacterium]